MSLLINFKDAVNASVLDPNATHAVFYMDGAYENEAEVRAQCPHAKLFAITVLGATGPSIFACDSETGDLPIPATETWVATQMRLGVSPTVVYANQDRWLNLGLLQALAAWGKRIKRWDADYDGIAAVPSWADAKQYMDGTVDLNVALATFFGGMPPVPKRDPHYDWFDNRRRVIVAGRTERGIVKSYDRLRKTQTFTKHPPIPRLRLHLLRIQCGTLADRLRSLPADTAARRGWRRKQLTARSNGRRLV